MSRDLFFLEVHQCLGDLGFSFFLLFCQLFERVIIRLTTTFVMLKSLYLMEAFLEAGGHLSCLLLLGTEHRVAAQLLLHLATLVPAVRCCE